MSNSKFVVLRLQDGGGTFEDVVPVGWTKDEKTAVDFVHKTAETIPSIFWMEIPELENLAVVRILYNPESDISTVVSDSVLDITNIVAEYFPGMIEVTQENGSGWDGTYVWCLVRGPEDKIAELQKILDQMF